MSKRTAKVERKTLETQITLKIDLDGTGKARVKSGLGFLDHMIGALSRHSRIDIDLQCSGDLDVDDHHTAEDCALALGEALNKALGERRGIVRFASAYAPLDEAMARAVIDLSGRPCSVVNLGLQRDQVGDIASENLTHFFVSLAMASKSAFHIDVLRGENDHHKAEAAFKALALALRQAVRDEGTGDVPSTKGVL